MALGDGTSWDETNPTNSTDANKIDDYNVDLRKGVRIRAEKEHETFAAASVGGRHKFMTLQNQASKPTLADSQVAAVYSKSDVLYYEMADGTEVAITNAAGEVNVPAMHMITRGFGLTYASAGSIYVEPGTLFHGSTRVNTTARTTLTPATDADWIDGSQPASLNDIWAYVYVKSDGTIKLEETSPSKADTAGNTVGKLIYHLEGSDYWRWIGGVRLDGSSNILKFYNVGDIVYYELPIALWTASADYTSWTDCDCSSGIPPTCTMGYFNCHGHHNTTGNRYYEIRPNGSTATSGLFRVDGYNTEEQDSGGNSGLIRTDTSQIIEFKSSVNGLYPRIHLEGYYNPRN